MMQFSRHLLWLFALSMSTGLGAQQPLQLEGTSIIGNKELPMVLYIVPWKSVQRFDISAPPITSIMEQKLEPIERASFRRTIDYHQAIFSKAKPVTPAID